MDLKLGGLERTTTPEGVHRVLRAAILDGTVPPGGQLRERDIAADLGVSRSPLREALTRLEEEGLIVKIPFRGAFVVEVGAQEVAEIASIRLLVEPYAGELALEALRGSERPRLTQTIEDLHRATEKNDIPASIDAHLQFHRLFYDLSGHGVLRGLWNSWETKLRLYLSVDHRSYSDLHDIADEHEGLAAVALEGDVEAFRRELAHHFQSALRAGTEDPANAPARARLSAGRRLLTGAPRSSGNRVDERDAAYQELATRLRGEAASVFLHEGAVWAPRPTSRTSSPTRWTTTSLTAELALGS